MSAFQVKCIQVGTFLSYVVSDSISTITKSRSFFLNAFDAFSYFNPQTAEVVPSHFPVYRQTVC